MQTKMASMEYTFPPSHTITSLSLSLANFTILTNNVTNVTDVSDMCHDKVGPEALLPWRIFTFWSLAAFIPVGLVLNFLSLEVYLGSWMRHGVPGRYFIALSLADNLVLAGELLLWLNTRYGYGEESVLGINFVHSSNFMCKTTYFLRYGSRVWSSWLMVAITMERFLTVTFPLKMVRLSSPRKAVVVIVSLGVVSFSMASFTFFTLVSKDYKGSPLCQFTAQRMYTFWIVAVIAVLGEMVVPSLLVSVLTVLILWRLALARKERQRMVEMASSRGMGRQKASELQTTIALVSIAIMFVTIRLPYIVTYFINMYKDKLWVCLGPWTSFTIYKIYTVAKVLAVLNYALNFCLYCVSGAPFRRELRRSLCQRRMRSVYGPTTGSSVLSGGREPTSPTLLRGSATALNSPQRMAAGRRGCSQGMLGRCRERAAILLNTGQRGSSSATFKASIKDSNGQDGSLNQGDSSQLDMCEKRMHSIMTKPKRDVIFKRNGVHLQDFSNYGRKQQGQKAVLVVMETSPNGVVTRL